MAFGLMLMVSCMTLFFQYAVTLLYTKKERKTVVPLAMLIASTLLAAILYGALTPTFPRALFDASGSEMSWESNMHIAWYMITLSDTILTVVVSRIWRIISFKGMHMVQHMSLLTPFFSARTSLLFVSRSRRSLRTSACGQLQLLGKSSPASEPFFPLLEIVVLIMS
jgi:hypothetical protein